MALLCWYIRMQIFVLFVVWKLFQHWSVFELKGNIFSRKSIEEFRLYKMNKLVVAICAVFVVVCVVEAKQCSAYGKTDMWGAMLWQERRYAMPGKL